MRKKREKRTAPIPSPGAVLFVRVAEFSDAGSAFLLATINFAMMMIRVFLNARRKELLKNRHSG